MFSGNAAGITSFQHNTVSRTTRRDLFRVLNIERQTVVLGANGGKCVFRCCQPPQSRGILFSAN